MMHLFRARAANFAVIASWHLLLKYIAALIECEMVVGRFTCLIKSFKRSIQVMTAEGGE